MADLGSLVFQGQWWTVRRRARDGQLLASQVYTEAGSWPLPEAIEHMPSLGSLINRDLEDSSWHCFVKADTRTEALRLGRAQLKADSLPSGEVA